jgi:hypothetical protein
MYEEKSMAAKRPAKRDLSKKKVTLKDLQAIQGGDKSTKVDKYPKPAKPAPAPSPSPGMKSWFGI